MASPASSPQPADNPWAGFLANFSNDPVGFVRSVWGAEPDPWQAQVLEAIARGERRISVRSGHGVGKTTTASWAMLWFLLTRVPVKVVVTAPSAAQLFDALMAETKGWAKKLPELFLNLLEIKADRIELKAAPEEAFISARTSRAEQPEALAGVHADWVLLVVDEASGVPESVFEAASGSMSTENACTLLLGNPVRSSGFFFDTHNRLRQTWLHMRVNCLDSPRVTADFITDMKGRYGEESNAYRVRVLGEFPTADDDCVIPMELIELSLIRDVEPVTRTPEVWGLDVARFGDDSSVLCRRKGNIVKSLQIWRKLDLMTLCGSVKSEYDALAPKDKPAEILIDSIGLGAGVVDRLRELQLPVRGINVSESPAMTTRFVNLRAELWFKGKEWFEKRDCRLPKDESLVAQLAGVRYKIADSTGRLQIESKADIKRRGLKSPDGADALMLTFASHAASILHGGRPVAPGMLLNRGLAGVV